MSATAPRRRRFSKMQGAGNDFVLLDLRDGSPPPGAGEVARMADRHFGIGCDQLLTIEPPSAPGLVADYRIWNADGSAAGQCGNGARCVAAWLRRDGAAAGARFAMGSPAGRIEVECLDDGTVRLAMAVPDFRPGAVPLAVPDARLRYVARTAAGDLAFGAVSMGNPHAVLEVQDLAATEVARLGPALQASGLFPEGVNVGFAEVHGPDHLGLRVFERGVGETLACGSGACAAVAVLARQGRVGPSVRIDLPGGSLHIDWAGEGHPVFMRGPAAFVFEGEWIDG
ncbi:diaminopimelate epimerase [Silanimonas lenta]|uniref:diaminopimelate epimerase n=1 Tax=Silanimonas lenta TaxID=265429 RepID=UPI00041AF061|nr:diaminopimelate epimerase [Silanimonas lenta]